METTTPHRATERQREMLRAIRELTEERGFPPTINELSARLGMKAKGGAASGLKALQKKELVTAEPRCARSIRLTEAGAAELLETATN